MIELHTPIADSDVERLRVGDQIEIEGVIYCARDAVLPKMAAMFERGELGGLNVDLKGAVIFHTAVSPAGIGPTTSNKAEIEESIPALSRAGVKIHLGKGSLSRRTVDELKANCSVFAVTPPVSALFSEKIITQRVAAFPEEGMEALYELRVKGFPAIIAAAHGAVIYERRSGRDDGGRRGK